MGIKLCWLRVDLYLGLRMFMTKIIAIVLITVNHVHVSIYTLLLLSPAPYQRHSGIYRLR